MMDERDVRLVIQPFFKVFPFRWSYFEMACRKCRGCVLRLDDGDARIVAALRDAAG